MPEEPDLDELAALRSIARRAGIDADHPLEPSEAPPADLWHRIATEAGVPVEPMATTTPAAAAPRHDRRWLLPLAAAAAVAVVAGVVTLGGGDDEPDVLASVVLDRLGPDGSGTAELVDDDGRLRLVVEAEGLDPGDGFLELWVIDPAVERLVSLGPLRADGTYDLPAGLDPEAFPIVDISVEPIDGDPTHSGASVLRGTLEL